MFDNLLGEPGRNEDLDMSRDSNPFVSSHLIKNREANYLSGGGDIRNAQDGSFSSLTQIVGIPIK